MIGLGVDTIEVHRMRRLLDRQPSARQRLFTPDECRYADAGPDPAQRYAARFCAKEAVMKALRVGIFDLDTQGIEIVRSRGGAPSVHLSGKAADLAARLGVTTWHVSMSHTETTATAVAVAL